MRFQIFLLAGTAIVTAVFAAPIAAGMSRFEVWKCTLIKLDVEDAEIFGTEHEQMID